MLGTMRSRTAGPRRRSLQGALAALACESRCDRCRTPPYQPTGSLTSSGVNLRGDDTANWLIDNAMCVTELSEEDRTILFLCFRYPQPRPCQGITSPSKITCSMRCRPRSGSGAVPAPEARRDAARQGPVRVRRHAAPRLFSDRLHRLAAVRAARTAHRRKSRSSATRARSASRCSWAVKPRRAAPSCRAPATLTG